MYQEGPWYWISGVTFRELMLGVERPLCLLLLEHDYRFAESDVLHTRLDYLDAELEALISDNSINSGDFWWVDFCSPEVLGSLPEQEFLELLYLKQLGKPLSSLYFPTLQNQFAYFGHDDGWALQLWVDSPEKLGRILAQVLTLKYVAFSGRRALPLPNELLANELVLRAHEGLLFDFGKVDAHASSVPIYRIGAAKNMDDARRMGDEACRGRLNNERLKVVDDQWQLDRTSGDD